MSVFHAIILGIVQGLGEFLPISSSAHLVLVPEFLGWHYQGLAYDVMLHIGTVAALAAYFWRDWWKIIRDGFATPFKGDGKILPLIVLGSIPAGLAGVLLHDMAEHVFRGQLVMAVNLIIFAGILFWADRRAGKNPGRAFDMKAALLIGFFQALALMPGVSRSGITITAALLCGFARSEAARISFIFSAPVIVGAGLFEARKLGLGQVDAAFVAGVLAAAASGWLAIKFLLGYVAKHTLNIFVVYRIALGLLIIGMVFGGRF